MAPSTTTLTFSPAVPVCGEPVTFTATVTGDGPTPTGTVTFLVSADGPAMTATLDGAGQATATFPNLGVGTHLAAAFYSGDANYDPSNSPLIPVVIAPGSTTTTLTTTPAAPVCGQPVQLCANVAVDPPSTCTATGNVSFVVDGGAPLTATLDGSGNACVPAGALSVGTHTVVVTYGGNTDVTGSTVTQTVTVSPASSSTVLTITPDPAVCGQSVSLCAQVTATPPSTCTPTGAVTFTVTGGPTLVGTLDPTGKACVSTGPLAVGTYPVAVSYAGDGSVNASTTSGTITVNMANTTTTVTSSPNPSAPGQTVTFTATVTPVAPATATPTGTVVFTISGGPTLTGTLNAFGQATASTNALTTGPHTVVATYVGDDCFNGSTSPTHTHVVTAAGTNLTATPATIRLRSNGTFVIPTLSATLRDAANNPIPGQTITFTANSAIGPISLGSAVTNASGTATLTNVPVSAVVITARTYTASFAGAPGLSPASATAPLTFQPTPILP